MLEGEQVARGLLQTRGDLVGGVNQLAYAVREQAAAVGQLIPRPIAAAPPEPARNRWSVIPRDCNWPNAELIVLRRLSTPALMPWVSGVSGNCWVSWVS